MILLRPDEDGDRPAAVSRQVLRLMALVNVISVQVALLVGLGAWLILERFVPVVVARAGMAFGVAVGVGCVVFWRIGQKWSRRWL